jgi:putative transcriptional regulator
MNASTAGRLLIATPTLLDPNFHRSVLFMVEHSEEGALGLVLNRPTAAPVSDHVADWADMAAPPALVFVGGPVANEVAVGLAQDPGTPPDSWVEALPGIGLIDLTEPPAAYGGVGRARVFSGYAGWESTQLDFELATGSWVLLTADADTVFTSDPADLWRRVLARDPGLLRMYASYPTDPRLN